MVAKIESPIFIRLNARVLNVYCKSYSVLLDYVLFCLSASTTVKRNEK